MSKVYKITNNINGKIYIGKTALNIEKRFKEHIQDSIKERCNKRPLYDAMNKYGVENFSIEELQSNLSDKEACQQEQFWIRYYNSYVGFDNCNGYNATLGGDSKQYYDYNKIATKYLELQNQKEVAKFFNCDILTVRKACLENNLNIISHQAFNLKNNGKKVAQINKDTDEIIATFNSLGEAALTALGNKKKKNGISNVCNGTSKTAYGYKWKYI